MLFSHFCQISQQKWYIISTNCLNLIYVTVALSSFLQVVQLFLGQYEEKEQYYIYDFNSFIADVGGRVVRIISINQQNNYTSSAM
jgi:hypothetical protein